MTTLSLETLIQMSQAAIRNDILCSLPDDMPSDVRSAVEDVIYSKFEIGENSFNENGLRSIFGESVSHNIVRTLSGVVIDKNTGCLAGPGVEPKP